jgi:hypothetical protein
MNPRFNCALLALCLIVVASCNRLEETMEITETRTISEHAPKAAVDITSATRFYDDAPEPSSTQPSMRSLLVWEVPEGWAELPEEESGSMRLVDLRFGPEGKGECYVSLMPGNAGGLAANVNRWRGQMGLEPLDDSGIEALPKRPFFNREATFISIDGDFSGFGASEARSDYRMLGLIHSAEQATIFVKLTGPKSVVEANAPQFEAFCQSISPNSAFFSE